MRRKLQERTQRRETGIAATHAVVPIAFQMIEEGHDQIGRDVGQRELRRRPAKARLGKAQEEHEGIPVSGHSARAEGALLCQVLDEEGLYERGKRWRWFGLPTHHRLPRDRRIARTARL